MTIVEKQHTTSNYYISVEITDMGGAGVYTVKVCPIYGNVCGYPIRAATYPVNEKKKAISTYKRYVKKYTGV